MDIQVLIYIYTHYNYLLYLNTYIHICWYQTPVLHSLFSNICCCFSFVRPHRWFQVISSGHGEWKLIDICSAEVAPVATTKTLRVRCFKSEPTIQVCKSFSYSIAFTQRNFGKLTSKLLFYSYSNAFPTCAWKKVFESTSSLYNSEPYIYIYILYPPSGMTGRQGKAKLWNSPEGNWSLVWSWDLLEDFHHEKHQVTRSKKKKVVVSNQGDFNMSRNSMKICYCDNDRYMTFSSWCSDVFFARCDICSSRFPWLST